MKKLFPAFLAFIFIACSSNTPAPTLKAFPPTITTTPVVESPTALPTFAVVETLTPLPLNVFPTPELLPTQITPTAQPMRTPLPEILPKFPLDGYVILFTKDSDLYFQDGNNSPIKLDHVIEVDYGSYKISDDNQKIAIGVAYSINTDGTQKQTTTFPNGWRDNYLWGVNFGGMDFVPSTHQLIFSSHFCTNNNSSCVSSVFLADTDTGEFRKLADLGFSGSRNHENFKVSPNGKMVAITTTNYVDIIDMEGKVIRHDVLPFKPNTPDLLFPSVFWLPDSSGLIVALPNTLFDSVAYNYVPAYTIWRYKIDSNVAVQIPLDPPPMAFDDIWDRIQVSPDGKWIVYGGTGGGTEVYLGNLENGQTQIFGTSVQASFSWSPDSKHFIVTSAGSAFASIDTPILLPVRDFGEWVDGNHFTWFTTQENIAKVGMAEIVSGGLEIYDLGFDQDVKLLLIKPK